MSGTSENRWKIWLILSAVILLFFAPILVSWYLVFFTEYKHGGGVQHGELIIPPRLLENVELYDPLTGSRGRLYGKWTALIIVSENCDKSCTDNLYRLRQIRLAMGKDIRHLQRAAWFMDKNTGREAGKWFSDYAGQTLVAEGINREEFLSRLSVNSALDEQVLYLIDPAGFLMMWYPPGTNPSGIIRDLKRLIRNANMN